MRNTKRTLQISGGIAAGGTLLILFGIWMFEREGDTWASNLPLLTGFATAPVALIWFVSSAVSGLRKEKLEAGAGEIARWRVSAAEWSAFREQEKRFLSAGRPLNILNLREGPARDGDVIFAAKAVIADEDYHDLIPGGLDDLLGIQWLQGSPSCFEFHFRTRRGGSGGPGSIIHSYLRVPIAAGEGREATKVFAHYTRITAPRIAIAMRNPRLTIKICFAVAAVCALAAIWGFSNRETSHLAVAPLAAAVVGVVLGFAALLLAGIVAYRAHVLKS